MRRALLYAALFAATAAPAFASGYKDSVTAPSGWSDGLDRVAVFVTAGSAVVNASEVERQVESRLGASQKLPFSVVPAALKSEKLMTVGLDGYDESRRAEILSAVDADAVLLVDVPHASQSQFGMHAAETRVTVRVVDSEGRIRMRGETSGRAWNTMSSPENIARHAVLRIIGKATGLNLD